MVTKGAKALIIASIDGTTLSDVLQKAAEAGVKVFAYDRLITQDARMSTTTPPSTISASACSRPIRWSRASRNAFPDVKPWNVELFGGSPDDNNAFYLL